MSTQLMQSVRVHQYGGPEQLKLEQISCPEPQTGEVLVRVHATRALPVEWKIRQGLGLRTGGTGSWKGTGAPKG
jgi:NADPH:quinone reductase-like Zn-dependent oxidoreductase